MNVRNSLARGDENDRWLRVTWSGSPGVTFPAEIVIVANKRVGLLADITTALANLRVFIHAVNAREIAGGRLQVSIRVDAPDVEYVSLSLIHIWIAAIAIGYADGVPRALSGRGYLLVRGRRAPILGRVCMDQLTVDVTGCDVRPGEEAVLIGRSGEERITAPQLCLLYTSC